MQITGSSLLIAAQAQRPQAAAPQAAKPQTHAFEPLLAAKTSPAKPQAAEEAAAQLYRPKAAAALDATRPGSTLDITI